MPQGLSEQLFNTGTMREVNGENAADVFNQAIEMMEISLSGGRGPATTPLTGLQPPGPTRLRFPTPTGPRPPEGPSSPASLVYPGLQNGVLSPEIVEMGGLDGAIAEVDKMLDLLDEDPDILPEFAAALEMRLAEANVDSLPRIGPGTAVPAPISTIEGLLLAVRGELVALRDRTEAAIAEARALQPEIDAGEFVITLLEADTGFNIAHPAQGFGREIVSNFVSVGCHASILAAHDVFPLGFEFLFP